MRFIELFAGIGGFRYGLESIQGRGCEVTPTNRDVPMSRGGEQWGRRDKQSAPYTCVWANEIDKYACETYRKNYGEGELYEGNIRTVNISDIPDHDLLVGGFPCQAFSIAGKRAGFDDTRGTLFFEIARILKYKRPRCVLLENVKGLLSHDGGKTFQTILKVLSDIGYRVEWQILNSKNFGVPQNRERVFIIGHLRGQSGGQIFPIGESDGGDTQKIQRGQLIRGRNKNTSGCLDTRGVNAFDRADLDKIVYDYGNIKIRRLTPTEAERLQGFPDGWTSGVSDSQRYKQCGNAVTTNVISAIGREIYKQDLMSQL